MAQRSELIKKPPATWLQWTLFFLTLGLLIGSIFIQSFLWMPKPPAERPYLVYEGDIYDFPLVIEDGEAYVPFDFIKNVLDKNAFWDKSGVCVITTKDKVVKLKKDSLTAYVNQHPVKLGFPVILDGNEPYIPQSVLSTVYPVTAKYIEESGVFLVKRLDVPRKIGKVNTSSVVRAGPSSLSRRVAIVKPDDEVELFETSGRWARVETKDGLPGFLPVKDVDMVEERPQEVFPEKDYVPPPLPGGKVVLTWEAVDSRNPDTSKIGPMPGLNVVSPTWFHLSEVPGELESRADLRYVNWAHSRGYQVWALLSNSFELTRTREVLRNSDLRDKVIAQLLIYSKVYKLDGINIDFENVYQEDAPYLTQFVREMVPLLHQQGLTVSVDITVKSNSPTWSLCYERSRLAEAADYVMLMAYDQYGQGSQVSGPVAAIPWTEWAIKKTLEEVPREKLVLGIPFYTRLWKETQKDGKTEVTQKAMGMQSIQNWLSSMGIRPALEEATGLNYAEKTVGQDTYKVWVEDKDSVQKRISLARKYDLAGIASWRRGFETPEIWDVIDGYARNP